MAYSESKRLTDTEKRLQALKTQLFGKEGNQIKVPVGTKVNIQTAAQKNTITSSYQHQELTYLRNDLRKIALLAFLAIGIQFLLYMQFTFKFLKLN